MPRGTLVEAATVSAIVSDDLRRDVAKEDG
jgi:hypothetical protein